MGVASLRKIRPSLVRQKNVHLVGKNRKVWRRKEKLGVKVTGWDL